MSSKHIYLELADSMIYVTTIRYTETTRKDNEFTQRKTYSQKKKTAKYIDLKCLILLSEN